MIRAISSYVFGFFVVTIGSAWLSTGFVKGYQFEWSPDEGVLYGTLYYLIMLFGILSSIVCGEIDAIGSGEVDFIKILRTLKEAQAIKAILVSPLIFIFILNSFGSDANGVMTAAFAYQNGFFWQQILCKLKP